MTAPTLPEFILARVADWEAMVRRWADIGYDPGSILSLERILAQCAAYRSIVALHSGEPSCESCYDFAPMESPCPTLLALAAIWAEHADYRDEWRP